MWETEKTQPQMCFLFFFPLSLSSPTLLFPLLDRDFFGLGLIDSAGLASKSVWSACPLPRCWNYKHVPSHLDFFLKDVVWGLKLRSYVKQVLYWLSYHPGPLIAYFKKRYLISNLTVCVYVCIHVYICVYLCVDMCVKWMHVPVEFRRGRQTPWVRLWVDAGNRGCQVLYMLLANCWAHSSVP